MECRRISTAVISVSFSKHEESIKRNQYTTLITCKYPSKESTLGRTFRYIYKSNAYYGVVNDEGRVAWFGVSGSASFLKEYPVRVTPTRTNLFSFIHHPENPENPANPEDTTGENPGGESLSVQASSWIVFSDDQVFIDCSSGIFVYGRDGSVCDSIDNGIDRVKNMYISYCNTYLIVNYERGTLLVYNIRTKSVHFQKKGLPGSMRVFGDVFSYSVFLRYRKSVLAFGRVRDGEVLLELTFPEDITAASIDILQKKIVVGGSSGKIYLSRIDGEAAAFTESKIANAAIEELAHSVCGSILYVLSLGTLSIVTLRDGKVARTVPTEGKSFTMAQVTSSNLHLK
ncbi:hypothetical protein NEDG_00709 [Nematocida displodere]|uniref:Uncharacterized protein n=1 Tax=Nematocida displodere TaxID=1805483 RepID=A0A177ECX2_9MICR|nr:hypothetical protein NEDG_00709 [Nematocida displodere]